MSTLSGKRILVVEDEAVIAAMVEDMLLELGALVIGPATTIGKGLELAGDHAPDAALLDMNIRGEPVEPIATLLRERSVPIVFASGYGRAGQVRRPHEAVLEKPFTVEQLSEALAALFA